MPEISRFFGIVIRMYYDEHAPPHFHALYSGDEAQIGIDPIHVLTGELPPRALSLVIEWAALHQRELMDNWNLARQDQKPRKVQPLR
jgi:phosphomannomutase